MDLSRRGFLSALGGAALIPPLPAEGRRVATEPLPREPLTGTCDGSGNATIKYRAPSSFWVHCYVAIQVSAGVPNYSITLGASGVPLVFGQGAQTNLGPVLLQPGEVASITVAGATAGAAVSGQVMGWQAPDPTQMLPLLPLQPTAVEVRAGYTAAVPFKISASLNGGADATLIPNVAGIVRVIAKGWIFTSPVEAATIFAFFIIGADGSHGVDFALFDNSVLGPQAFDFGMYALSSGLGVGLHNYGANTHAYNGLFSFVPVG